MWAIATLGPNAYWYLTRGTGVVALVLLTASVVVGIVGTVRFAAPRWPRFAIDIVHRDLSLLVIVLLVIHILTSVLDSFAPIRLTDAVIPFASRYRPLWLGLGALAFDILVAIAVTSLVRRRLGYGTWRGVHRLAYASWPIAVLHGLGTGSDTKIGWVLAITAACIAAVTVATLVRIVRSGDGHAEWQGAAIAVTLALPVGIALFAIEGPLQTGWARSAGTPVALLSRPVTRASATQPRRTGSKPEAATLRAPFSARLSGTVTRTEEAGGRIVDLALRLSGGARGKLRVRLAGTPDGGGVSLTGSQVDLLASGLPSVMAGEIVSLDSTDGGAGADLRARVADTYGAGLDLAASIDIDGQTGAVSGTLSATDPTGSGR